MKIFIALLLSFLASCLTPHGGAILGGGSGGEGSNGIVLPIPGVSFNTNIPYRGTSVTITNATRELNLEITVGSRLHLSSLEPGKTWVLPALRNWSGTYSTSSIVVLGRTPRGEIAGAYDTTISVSGYNHEERAIIVRENDLR